jgi:hypothetical protein
MVKIGKKYKNLFKLEMEHRLDHMLKSFSLEWKKKLTINNLIQIILNYKIKKTTLNCNRILKDNPRKSIIIPILLAKCIKLY